MVEDMLSCLGSEQVRLTAEEHDRITADTQAVTHAAFLRYVGKDILGYEGREKTEKDL